MLIDIPKNINEAMTLFIAKSDTIFDTVIHGDKEFNTHTDFYYDDIDDALEDVKRLY